MSAAQKFFGLSIVGTLVGGLLALTAPLSAATAEPGCKCAQDGLGTSKYSCSKNQAECIPGVEVCEIKCSE